MNKELYDVLEATKEALNGQLDQESQRYVDRQILERKLDGKIKILIKDFSIKINS
jgi:hypothetical protein